MAPALAFLRGAARLVLGSAPVWVPLGLALQIAVLGLRPALDERERLALDEELLRARRADLVAEREHLDRALRALADPMFLERERRALLDPKGRLR